MAMPAPTFTQTPNIVTDEWLRHLGFAELKILMVIMRKTFGWHKIRDRISLNQLQFYTGLSRRHVTKGVKSLVERGLINKIQKGKKGEQATYFELIVIDNSSNSYQCPLDTTPDENIEFSNNSYQCPLDTPPSVLRTPTKERTKENISPIVPKGDTPSFSEKPPKRKKIVEERVEVAEGVLLTQSQQESLLKRAKGDQALLAKWYDKLSTWKINKGIFGGTGDYLAIIKWVEDAVAQEMATKSTSKESIVDKHRDFGKEIEKKLLHHPKSKEVVVSNSYIEFLYGPQKSVVVKFGESGFEEQVVNNLRKMGIFL